MAKKKSGRKEPVFGVSASLSELRMKPDDRVSSGDDTPKPGNLLNDIIAEGPPETIAESPGSYTGEFLRRILTK